MISSGVFQTDENDCGAAALATVLKIFRKNIPLHKVKREVLNDSNGASILDLSKGAKYFGLLPSELQGNYQELLEAINLNEVKFPFIAHVIKDESFYHFIVVTKKSRNKFYIFDPASGKKSITNEEFSEIWTGNIITFDKSDSFQTRRINVSFYKSLNILKEYKKYIYINLILIGIVSLCSIISARFYQNIIDRHIMGREQDSILSALFNIESIKFLLFCFVTLMILQNIFNFILEVILIRVNAKMEKQLIKGFYKKIFTLPIPFYQNRKSGDFITRVQDIETVTGYLSNTVLSFISSIIMAFIGGIILANINFQLFIIVLIGTCLYVLVSIPIIPIFSRNMRKLVEKRASLYSRFKENIDTIESIKIMQDEKTFTTKIKNTSYEFITLKKENSVVLSFFQFIINNVEAITNGSVLFFGILFVIDDKISLGSFLAFQSLMMFFISPIKELVSIRAETQKYIVSNDRLEDFLEADSENYKQSISIKSTSNDLYLENLSFSYPSSENIITNFSYEIKEGTKVFIEGGNGSGKSTFVKLLNKTIIPDSGEIYLGGYAYKNLPVNFVRSKVMYSSQENYIFNGTLEENLFLKKIDTDKMNKNLKNIIHSKILDNVLKDFVDGWHTQIKEKGSNLSEGQKKIIGICRLLIKGAPIMIFDESISKIDSSTKNKLIDFIFENYKDNTCIFIDHEKTMKERCDVTINVDNKQILNTVL